MTTSAQPEGAIRVKICGLRRPEDVRAATMGASPAAYVGFVFVAASPRAVTAQEAAALAQETPAGVEKVGLFVDPTDDQIRETLEVCPLDMLQLHGGETPARVAEIRSAFGRPVIKALPIGGAEDVAAIAAHEEVADEILCDAKPGADAAIPGGSGHAFDWALVAGRTWRRPWLLAGGLTSENVADAVAASGARRLDVSSGVERIRGVKDPDRIRAFLEAAARIAVPPPA
ncbi:MAG: phosphoribosylanthranilate isomerase [Pseudomonadota bacterium]